MGARLHLMEKDFEKAKGLFKCAVQFTSKKKRRKKNGYIIEYCRYHLSRLNGHDDNRPLLVHNVGFGTREEDRIFARLFTGHYRWAV